jgi:MerR family redox-sensitive transcriptional activator SoxR
MVVVKVDLMSSTESLTIGELAGLSGRAASSIRYYEAIGLLPEPVRVGGRRRYPPETVRTLAIVDTAQRAGLTLDEIATLLHASPDAVDELRAIAERKLPELTAMIERATLVRSWLECAARCECPTLDDCALFDDRDALPPVHPAARWARTQ